MGWNLKKVALLQIMSAAVAFIGLYIGIAVAQTEGVREWIFAVAAGMFLYVALTDVVCIIHIGFFLSVISLLIPYYYLQ